MPYAPRRSRGSWSSCARRRRSPVSYTHLGLGVGIYKTVVRPPQKTEPVVETQPEAEETKEPEIKLPTIKHVVTKVDEDTGEEIEEELELPASHRVGVYNILICGTDDDGYRTDCLLYTSRCV